MSSDLIEEKSWSGKAFSTGWRALEGGVLEVIEPATGARLTTVGKASAADVRKAASAARKAQAGWAELPHQARAAVFLKAAGLLDAHRDAFTGWIVRETGAIPPKGGFEVEAVIHLLHEAAAMQTQPRGLVLPSANGVSSTARRVPLGVVGVISPFNFPLILSSRAVLPALAASNAVVLKPDPRTPVTGGILLARVLEAAGLPDGVLHVLPGEAEAGEALVTDPDVAMISFTGSTAVGRRIGELAGRNLKKVALELGGKNALVVCEDADLDLAASNGAWASWMHQGQICMSAGRHLVHASVLDAYVQRMVAKAKVLPVGDPARGPCALGPIITLKQTERVQRLIRESVAMGAQVVAGGSAQGQFHEPTVVVNVTPQMPLYREEIFGPVVAITSFQTDDEAVALANDTEYGLSAGVLTRDVARGMAIAQRLHVGLVHVNDQTVNDDGTMPMGGQKASGNGSRHGGPANWEEFSQWQWMTVRSTPPQYPM